MDGNGAIWMIVVLAVVIIGAQVLFGNKRRRGSGGSGPDGNDSDSGSGGGGDGGGGGD
jgi:uncharacterized membrane protein YgcG